MVIELTEVHQICTRHQIVVKDIETILGSFSKQIFSINQEYLLRVSAQPMTLEQEKFRRVARLDFVPRMLASGSLERETGPLHYTLLTRLPGDDFVNGFYQTTITQQKQLGKDIAAFLDNLQEIEGTHYDIGFYIPVLPQISGSWRAGHQEYWERLKRDAAGLNVAPESKQVFENADRFIQASISALDYQTGPKLLHNDFHPKNMLLDQGRFSGVIDWECSQFGEADFDLSHFIHWSVYPPEPGIDFKPFLSALFESAPQCTRVPDLARRLTIYQIEHEIQQIIWSGGGAESWRVPRLAAWLDGALEDLRLPLTGITVSGRSTP